MNGRVVQRIIGLTLVALSLAGCSGAQPEPVDTPALTHTMRSPSPTPPLTWTPRAKSTIEPTLVPGAPQTRPADDMVMVYVPGGTFQMGSTDAEIDAVVAQCEQYFSECERSWYENESPQHTVTLDSFWIDQTEVTNAQYALCVTDGKCDESFFADDSNYNGDDYPAVGVSWNDAVDYCTWTGAQLPTEAQWEYAARGPDGYIYPWGNDAPTCELAQFGECSWGTVPVGSFPDGASWCNALDMAGNVWEWVADWYGDYPSESQTNPTGPTEGDYRVLRGGSFSYPEMYVRVSYRLFITPGDRGYNIGFRCVGVAPGP